MNVNRWLKYAKAKLDDTLMSGNKERDELEARQEADRAERPWLASEGGAPTFDEAKARIAWETEQAGRAEQRRTASPATDAAADRGHTTSDRPGPNGENADRSTPGDHVSPSLPTDPQTDAEAAERSSARIVLDQRAEESAARLAQIRAELGVDDPAPPPG